VTVRELTTADELHQYVAFASTVYDEIPAWVPPDADHMVAQLSGQALGGSHTRIQPFWVEDNERILAVGCRTAEELGARIRRNFVVYQRDL
jgi:hypothetical protein